MVDLILGTAGHIDHGKTALVRALTGTDTDRLPEEKLRGITIEPGFAELVLDGYRLGIVDVPGHERFVRQMLSAATGMDLAMLVVAADDSVKAQTREHMDVLRLLNLKAGVIVLTKCDLAEPGWIDLVEQEVRDLVQGSFLETSAAVRTSAVTGLGLDALKQELVRAAQTACDQDPGKSTSPAFRMSIDRVFSLAGHGTVVTGSVSSGVVRTGDVLSVQPQGTEVRIRGLQNHDRSVEEVHRGQRAALNLAGIPADQLRRGHTLATPGTIRASKTLAVELHALPGNTRPIKHRTRLRFHAGTADLPAAVYLLDRTELAPGDRCLAQLALKAPAACVWDEPFVIRSESPMRTLGGGRVLVPVAARLRKPSEDDLRFLARLRANDVPTRTGAAIYFASVTAWERRDLGWMAGTPKPDEVIEQLLQNGSLVQLRTATGRTLLLHRHRLAALRDKILSHLTNLHDREPLATLFESSRFTSRMTHLADAPVVGAVLEWLAGEHQIRQVQQRVGLADRQPRLTSAQAKVLAQSIEALDVASLQPPSLAELQKCHPQQARELERLLNTAVADGVLTRVHKDYFLHQAAEAKLRSMVTKALAGGNALTVSEIRELLGITRKHAVPLCEYLDRVGVTRRKGDQRELASEGP